MARRPKVLICYDGSPEGEDALGLGQSLSQALDARPIVTTVIAHPRHGTDEGEFDEAVSKYCEPLFAKARERLDGLDVMTRPVVHDSPAAAIYEITDWETPTVIAIGSSRHGKSGRVQVGTLGGSLLSGVHCSVAVAPRDYTKRESGFEHIGVALDGSGESLRALSAAAYLAGRENVPLQALSVMEEPHYVLGGLLSPLGPAEYREYKEKEWERVYEKARSRVPEEIAMEPLLLHGEPADVLAQRARDLDLLVIGSRGYGPVKGTLLGSVSTRVMTAAPCPVMVVPRGAGSRPLDV